MESGISHDTASGIPDRVPSAPGGQALAEKIVETCPDGIMVCGSDRKIVWVNPAFCEMTGFSAGEAVGATPRLLHSGFHDEAFYQAMRSALAAGGHWQGEIWNRHRNGRIFPTWMSLRVVVDASAACEPYYIARYYGLEDQRNLPGFLHRMAYFDSVTGLPNRNLIFDRLQQATRRAMRADSLLAVLFIDLDNFKAINDTFGHDCGDQVLKQVADRLVHCVRENDTLARFGGDEFAAILPDLAGSAAAAPVAERIVQRLAAPFSFNGGAISITVSIGISLFPSDAKDAVILVKHADAAMYRVKEAGKNRFQFYSS